MCFFENFIRNQKINHSKKEKKKAVFEKNTAFYFVFLGILKLKLSKRVMNCLFLHHNNTKIAPKRKNRKKSKKIEKISKKALTNRNVCDILVERC